MIEFEKYLDDKEVIEFLDYLNVEAHDLSAFDLDFIILKAKEFGYIESYEPVRMDESDIIYLFIAELLSAFDNDKKAIAHLRPNFVNIKSFTTTKKAKTELLNALYNIQNGVIGGRERILVKKWRTLGLVELWYRHVDALITHIKSIHETDDYYSSDRKYLQSVIDDVSNQSQSYANGSKKHSFTRKSIFLSISVLLFFFIFIALLASVQKISVQSHKFYLNFTGSDAIAVVTQTSIINSHLELDAQEHLYRQIVTFITAQGQEVVASVEHVCDYRKVPAVGSQLWVVYEKENPYNLTLRSPYVNAYKLIFYLILSAAALGLVLLFLRFFILSHVKSHTIKSVLFFSILTAVLFAVSYVFIFENRFIFYRFVGARPVSDFTYVEEMLIKKSDGKAYTGLVKTKHNGQILISSYRKGKLEGLSVSYEKDVIRMLGNYSNGYLNGLFVRYDSKGSPLEYAFFENGRKNGFYREYDERTYKIVYEGLYKKGLRHGAFRTFYPSGKIRKVERFIKDKLNGIAREFYEDGQIKYELHYKYGLLNGRCQAFDKNGKPTVDVFIKNGMYLNTLVSDMEDVKQNPMSGVSIE